MSALGDVHGERTAGQKVRRRYEPVRSRTSTEQTTGWGVPVSRCVSSRFSTSSYSRALDADRVRRPLGRSVARAARLGRAGGRRGRIGGAAAPGRAARYRPPRTCEGQAMKLLDDPLFRPAPGLDGGLGVAPAAV